MRSTFTTAIIIAVLFLFIPSKATSPLEQIEEPNIRPPVEQSAPKPYRTLQHAPVDPAPYKAELRAIAIAKGLPEAKIVEIEKTIGGVPGNEVCPNGESGWYDKAVGDNGHSLGMVQINLPSHPNVTREQALDATFSLNFIVDAWLNDDMWMWTCYNALYGEKLPIQETEN